MFLKCLLEKMAEHKILEETQSYIEKMEAVEQDRLGSPLQFKFSSNKIFYSTGSKFNLVASFFKFC